MLATVGIIGLVLVIVVVAFAITRGSGGPIVTASPVNWTQTDVTACWNENGLIFQKQEAMESVIDQNNPIDEPDVSSARAAISTAVDEFTSYVSGLSLTYHSRDDLAKFTQALLEATKPFRSPMTADDYSAVWVGLISVGYGDYSDTCTNIENWVNAHVPQ